MFVIGYGHRARQGKNTAALAVLNSCPLKMWVHMYAFADALRMEVRKVCAKFGGQFALLQAWKDAGLMPEWVQYEEPKPRSLLQWWGTEYRRGQDPDYWVKRLHATLEDHKPELALITDVRFPNEVDALRDWGGVYVDVINTNAPDVDVHEHPSEAALDDVKPDYLLCADSAEDCRVKAVELYHRIMREHGK